MKPWTPRPEWVGQARGRPFFGHRMVPGVSADKLGLSEAERASLALFAADIQDQTLLAEAHVITDLSRR